MKRFWKRMCNVHINLKLKSWSILKRNPIWITHLTRDMADKTSHQIFTRHPGEMFESSRHEDLPPSVYSQLTKRALRSHMKIYLRGEWLMSWEGWVVKCYSSTGTRTQRNLRHNMDEYIVNNPICLTFVVVKLSSINCSRKYL